MSFPILTTMIAVPVVGALLVLLLSNRRPEWVKLTALLTSVVTAGLTIWTLVAFKTDDGGFQFVSMHPWIPAWGISWHLGIDGISLFLVVLTGVLFPLVIAGVDPHHDHKRYFAWMLLLEAGMLGAFVSLDLFLFFVFFEIVLVPMYFLIGGWGYDNRVYAATKFFVFTMFGSAFMLVGTIATAVLAKSNGVGHITFDLVEIADKANFAASTGRWLFFAFAIAFAIKVPLFPLHTWLPDAHTQAPTGGSVILAAVMLKLGTYGLLRFGVFLFPEAAQLGQTAADHAGGHRHPVGRHRGHDAEGPQTDRRLLLGGPPRVHRARRVRHHHPVDDRRRDADDQPRRVHRRAVPPRRDDLRAPAHPPGQRAEGPPEGRPGVRRGVHGGDAVVDRRARAQRLRRRVPHPDRLVPHRPLVGGGRRRSA